jgi:outer membrane protein insertion porin family
LSYSKSDSRVTDRYIIGPDIMRGFESGGIGPREVGTGGVDDALGGNYYAVARFEAEFPLGLPDEYGITGGLFYDVGSVWGLSDSTQNKATSSIVSEGFDARHVVGFSLLWDSAIGPLRLNFSEPLKKAKWDKTQNFNLTISTQF